MRALALFSGGLDSVLAMKLVKDQGIDVIAVNVNTGFGSTNDRRDHMQNMCDQIGVKLEILDLRDDYLKEVLFDPKYGYGKNFNPCIDCHGFMYRHTGKLLEKYNAQFMISGEVIGQRPMSQRKDAMDQVASLSGDCDDLIVRPLSAKLLPESKPEREGWIDRSKLQDFNGRGRDRQFALANEIGLTDFESPGGGCLLTDIGFSNRIEEFIKHEKLEIKDIDTLKSGRHLRLPGGAKLIVGRHQEDNQRIEKIENDKYCKFKINNATGPLAMLETKASEEDKQLAAKIIISYGKTNLDEEYEVVIDGKSFKDTKYPSKETISQYLI
jgi:tRNA-specific 2-thiouridylase